MRTRGRPSPPGPKTPDFELFPTLERSWPAHGLGPVAVIVAQLPSPTELREGALVLVRDAGKPARGFKRFALAIRRVWQRPPRAHAAIRCTALLARGYREISVRVDPRTGETLVWGFAPTTSVRSS